MIESRLNCGAAMSVCGLLGTARTRKVCSHGETPCWNTSTEHKHRRMVSANRSQTIKTGNKKVFTHDAVPSEDVLFDVSKRSTLDEQEDLNEYRRRKRRSLGEGMFRYVLFTELRDSRN